jgi:hypothetical protein
MARRRPTCRSLPTKFELIINLKTAMAIGHDMSPVLLAGQSQAFQSYDQTYHPIPMQTHELLQFSEESRGYWHGRCCRLT